MKIDREIIIFAQHLPCLSSEKPTRNCPKRPRRGKGFGDGEFVMAMFFLRHNNAMLIIL